MSGESPKRTPLEDFAAELAKSGTESPESSAKKYAKALYDHLVAFIGRRDYVEAVTTERRGAEWLLYHEYIHKQEIALPAQMGLVLRDWESDPARQKDIKHLRNVIRSAHGDVGLHIAEVVQSRVLTGVVPAIIGSVGSKERAASLIEAFLTESINLCLFVQEKDYPAAITQAVVGLLNGKRPPLFVLFARGTAIEICNLAARPLMDTVREYEFQVHDIYRSRIVVLIRSDLASSRGRS